MLAVISPAKTLDYATPLQISKYSQPEFLDKSSTLIKTLSTKSSEQISELMHISSNLADLNQQRYAEWQTPFTTDNARQAILAFKGDVYLGLEAWNLSSRDLNWAQKHLRILSGLYGLLKPLDLMQAYRLEMGTKLKVGSDVDLYHFWQKTLSDHLNSTLEESRHKVLINLASQEYYKVLNPEQITCRIITPTFLDLKNGKYKFISFFAKKARGLMARYLIEQRVSTVKALKAFNLSGYRYCEQRSKVDDWVFIRDEAN